ncbi:MAG: hypothetical protein DRR42_11385 [Gammaproteobacteria bacterium]|nr:MAG: hypothetical protein DRR42_11385 [Gammaproteobacteria bacterium]
MPRAKKKEDTIEETTEVIVVGADSPAMETVINVREPMTALEKLKEELQSKRNLDTDKLNSEFNLDHAIDMVLELDKYTQISVFNSWKFFLNMNCIRQALRILPENIEKTCDGREEYDQIIRETTEFLEQEGDFISKLPAFIALNEKLRVTMYDNMLEPSTMEDTLKFMTENKPLAINFEKDYDERVRQGQKPGISKRVFCEVQLEDAMKSHHQLNERGQAAIEFCNDLNIHADRGHGDLPDWVIDTLYNKLTDKLTIRWQKLDIRRTGLRTKPSDRTEAEADQLLIEFVYNDLTGREFTREYGI